MNKLPVTSIISAMLMTIILSTDISAATQAVTNNSAAVNGTIVSWGCDYIFTAGAGEAITGGHDGRRDCEYSEQHRDRWK